MRVVYKPAKRQIGESLESIPVGEAVDAEWADWAETVGFQDSQPMDFQMTDKLGIEPLDDGFLDPFASVTKKSL